MKWLRQCGQRWDQAVLLRWPVAWQLRLHTFGPLALATLALWLLATAWLAQPARWLGDGGVPATDAYRTPEAHALELCRIVLGILGLLQGLWWLVRVRVHNRWRDHLPAGRFAPWHEYVLGAVLCALLLLPTLGFDEVYRAGSQQRWQAASARAAMPADADWQDRRGRVQDVSALEFVVARSNAFLLPFWDEVAGSDEAAAKFDGEREEESEGDVLQALRLLKAGDEAAIAARIGRYAQALRAMGYAPAGAGAAGAADAEAAIHAQARALIAAYRTQLANHQAAWRAAHAAMRDGAQAHADPSAPPPHGAPPLMNSKREPGPGPAAAWQMEAARVQACRDQLGRGLAVDVPGCMQALARVPQAQRLQWLRMAWRHDDTPEAHVRWAHPRFGEAVFKQQLDHFRRMEGQMTVPKAIGEVGSLAVAALIAALALLAVRLLRLGQLAATGAALMLLMPAVALLDALGLGGELGWAGLGVVCLAVGLGRIWRGRPWGGHLWLAWGTALSLASLAWGANVLRGWMLPSHLEREAWPMLAALLDGPLFAVAMLVFMGLLAPALRRWRGLPER